MLREGARLSTYRQARCAPGARGAQHFSFASLHRAGWGKSFQLNSDLLAEVLRRKRTASATLFPRARAGEGWGGLPMFRAYDKRTGDIVWETQIPAGTQSGLPMTYMHKGRQYIVLAIGSNKHQAEFVALALR